MKLAKHIIAILLIASLCFSMVACASANILGVSTPTTPLAVSDGSTVSDSETPVAYRNDYFKYTCVLPDDWYVLNEDEVSQALGLTFDALENSDLVDVYEEMFDSGVSKMDFYAFCGDGTQTINIVLSKAKILELLLPEKMLLDAIAPNLIKGLADMGATNISYSTENINFLSKKHFVLSIQAESLGADIYETIVVQRKDFYLSTFTVTGSNQADLQNQLGYFQEID